MKQHSVNEEIDGIRVVLIDSDGSRIGEFMKSDAMEMAESEEKDLVQFGEAEGKPICKIIDYGKYLYHQRKTDKEHRKNSKTVKTKEVRIGVQSDTSYLVLKSEQAKKFLEEGHRVKLSVAFKGRQRGNSGLIYGKCKQFADMLVDNAVVEQNPIISGYSATMIFVPK